MQFCIVSVKEVNGTAYRNWTSWHVTILSYIFDTANCLPWVTGTSLTYPYCQRALAKTRTELANQSTVWLVLLIVIVINFLRPKFIDMTVTAEAWLKYIPGYQYLWVSCHGKLLYLFVCISLIHLFMWKWPCYVILMHFGSEFLPCLRAYCSGVQHAQVRISLLLTIILWACLENNSIDSKFC